MRFANPSSCRTLTDYSFRVSPAHCERNWTLPAFADILRLWKGDRDHEVVFPSPITGRPYYAGVIQQHIGVIGLGWHTFRLEDRPESSGWTRAERCQRSFPGAAPEFVNGPGLGQNALQGFQRLATDRFQNLSNPLS